MDKVIIDNQVDWVYSFGKDFLIIIAVNKWFFFKSIVVDDFRIETLETIKFFLCLP